MRTFKIVAITVLSIGFLAAAGLFLIGYFKPKPAGILITSTPTSSVFIDGQLMGKTPYEGVFDPGTVLVGLIPDEVDKKYVPYEAKVTLASGIKTIVRRELSETEEASSGDIVSFEKEAGKSASLVAISDPDIAQVLINGTPRGFSPYKSSSLSVGEHQVTIKSPGFIERTLTVKTVAGYKLTIIVKLGKIVEEPKAEAIAVEKKTYVEILDTPTGFLRVRSLPGSAGREIHQVKPGEKYLFLDEDNDSGWFKIQLEAPTTGLPEGRSGWVSDEYSQKIEEEVTPTPTPST